MKKILIFVLVVSLGLSCPALTVCAENEVAEEAASEDELGLTASSAVLMEASTGTVILEKNSHEQLPPASVTKIMTLLLIFDAISDGKIRLEDTVTTSAYAASMGGSQVFLEEGETQTVDTMIKCISVASANDASVAMAEYIAGTEELFVEMMNARAAELGMEDTHFVNCCGLDADGHVTTAYDIALMSRELITKYPQIHNYSTIWMENITHTTRRGTEEFGLTNTNKLIRQYPYATGLKTGSTSQAKYCVSATAEKDGIELIAVIMAAPDPQGRFADATALLNYGYGKCSLYRDTEELPAVSVPVSFGVLDEVEGRYDGSFTYLSTTGENLDGIEKKWLGVTELTAPVEEGQQIGKLAYYLDGQEIGNVPILAAEGVERAGYGHYLKKAAEYLLL
jgi:D-alanyl-D-alanine carboxypeptidase (penicillin-binding protein 5/6)